MRSSASHLLSVPRHNLSFGARAFRVTAPKIWNSIPLHICQSQTYSFFKRHLKTHYFLSAHLAPIAAPVMCHDSLPRLWRYINLLLTYLPIYSERIATSILWYAENYMVKSAVNTGSWFYWKPHNIFVLSKAEFSNQYTRTYLAVLTFRNCN